MDKRAAACQFGSLSLPLKGLTPHQTLGTSGFGVPHVTTSSFCRIPSKGHSFFLHLFSDIPHRW